MAEVDIISAMAERIHQRLTDKLITILRRRSANEGECDIARGED